MEEQPVIEQQAAASEAAAKTTVFAPRIPVSMRQDIEAIQGLIGMSVNEVGVEALTLWLETKLADETLGAKALAEMDAEQQRLDQRRASLAKTLGSRAATEATPQPASVTPTRAAGKLSKAAASSDEPK